MDNVNVPDPKPTYMISLCELAQEPVCAGYNCARIVNLEAMLSSRIMLTMSISGITRIPRSCA